MPLPAAHSGAVVPDWPAIEGLICGFGDRQAAPPPSTILLQRQVHGTVVMDVPADDAQLLGAADDGLRRLAGDADALVARQAGRIVGVRTADCVPLLLAVPRLRWAAAVHAGWRGTLAGIAVEALQAAVRAGARCDEVLAALGPSIGPCCYEVSRELGREFAEAGSTVLDRSGQPWEDAPAAQNKPHLDLRAANRVQLERSGVPAANIQDVGPCTRCARDRFHSFRAEPGSPGRQVSWIGWAAGVDRRPFPDPEPTR